MNKKGINIALSVILALFGGLLIYYAHGKNNTDTAMGAVLIVYAAARLMMYGYFGRREK